MIFWLIAISLSITASMLTTWAALIVQSLGASGSQKPFFTSTLSFDADPQDDDIIILKSDFKFFDSNGAMVLARKGLRSDGASVGRLLCIPLIGLLIRWLIKGGPLEGPLRPAAIAHDAIYATAEETTLWAAFISCRRAWADRVIFEAACCSTYRLSGAIVHRKPMATWRAFIVMAILRVFGSLAWLEDSVAARSLKSLHN